MSRIGKKVIPIPSGVTVNFQKSTNKVSVKGSKGELHQTIDPDFVIKTENNEVLVERPTEQKRCTVCTAL